MDASTSPVADVHSTEAGQSSTPQFEGTPDVGETSPIDDDTEDTPQKPTVPMQKRRRVTRAW